MSASASIPVAQAAHPDSSITSRRAKRGTYTNVSSGPAFSPGRAARLASPASPTDRKSTRLNSSHLVISYAVFCLKKKKFISEHLISPHLLRSLVCPLRRHHDQRRAGSLAS